MSHDLEGTTVCESKMKTCVDPGRRDEGVWLQNDVGNSTGSTPRLKDMELGLDNMDRRNKELRVPSKCEYVEQEIGASCGKADDAAETGSREQPKRRGTLFGSLVSIGMTVMGFGLLSLPSAFAKSGVFPATVLIICFGILTDVSLCMLVKVARLTRQRSMESIAEYFFGPIGRKILSWSLILLLFVVCVSIFTTFMKTLGKTSNEAGDAPAGLIRQLVGCGPEQCDGLNKVTVGFVGLIVIYPLLLRESLHELRHASMLAGICLFVSIVIFTYTYAELIDSGDFDPIHESVRYATDSLGFCSAFGIAFTCFLCHFNILQVDSELEKPEQIYTIIHLTILGMAIPVNLFVGACGYFLFGNTVEGNVFDSMHSNLGNVAAGAVALTSMLKLPLVFKPFKDTLFAEMGVKDQKFIRAFISAVLALFSFLVAIFVELSDVNAIGGSFCGAAIGFFFPGLFTLVSALGIKFEKTPVAAYAQQVSEKVASPDDDVGTVAVKAALPEKFVSKGDIPPLPDVSLSTSTVDTDRGAEFAMTMKDIELLPVSEDVASPSSDDVNGNDNNTKAPSSFMERWKKLPVERRRIVAQGLLFCVLGFVCGTVGVSTALISVIRRAD